mmetsp:Transcript_7876/g.17354  ORF Transcript_7876/g.17354 Transcript_7876/m.17354 type:complete len:931 (-) Transcript_7876:12-2804(-)
MGCGASAQPQQNQASSGGQDASKPAATEQQKTEEPKKEAPEAEVKVDAPAAKTAEEAKKSVVIIGWGPVGNSVLTKLVSKAPKKFTCTIIGEECYPAYNRVKLTSFFEHKDPNKLTLNTPEWCQDNGVNLIFGQATKIDRTARKVEYASKTGEAGSVTYDDLVIATGSKPFVPPTPGMTTETKGVFVYRTFDDLFAMMERAMRSKKAAVIGGGLLGLEAAKAAYDLKLETHILEMAPHLMPVQLDADAGGMLKAKVQALGPVVHCGVKVLEVVSGDNGVTGIKINEDGEDKVLDVDMVIVSAGVRPRQELAESCGLALGSRGGIKTDGYMRSTTDEHVWAVGEIASFDGGMCYQISAPGYTQAEIIADKLADPASTSQFSGADLSTKLKLLGVDVASFGGSGDFWFKRQYMSTDDTLVLNRVQKDDEKGIYKKLVFTPDGKRLLGGILVGDISAFTKLTSVSKRPDLGGMFPDELMEGKYPKVDDGGDGTGLGDDDHVCNCHNVPKKVIRKAIQEGAHTFDAIKKCTKAGTGCGSCIMTGPQPKLLSHTLNKMGVQVGACKALPFPLEDIEDLAKARQLKYMDQLVNVLGYPEAAEPDNDAVALGTVLDRLNGKTKGEGMDQIGQLKALREDLWKFVDKVNCNPIFLRLAWHDAGTYDKNKTEFGERGGANGSIIYDPEINHGANNGLFKAVGYLKPFKEDYPLVSWADLIQMAGAVGIEHAGGPKVAMKYGRKDVSGPEGCPGRQSRGTADNAGLPDAFAGPDGKFGCGAPDAATHCRNIFYRMGFDDKAIVALQGAHTIGRAFKERSGTVAEGYGEANACPYTKAVPKGCPIRHDAAGGVGMPGGKSWTTKWLKFDNEYFQPHVYEEKDPNLFWAATDKSLHTDEEFKKYFMLYKDDQAAFFRDFAEAMKKLSELGAEWSPSEGITID